jgi:hypothetical protein
MGSARQRGCPAARSRGGGLREPSVFSIYCAKILDKVILLTLNFLFWISPHIEKYPVAGEHQMLTVPSSLQTQFQTWLRNSAVPNKEHALCMK